MRTFANALNKAKTDRLGARVIARFAMTQLKAFYQRLRDSGKPKLVALSAAMRKLLTTLDDMFQSNSLWSGTLINA